MGHTNKATLNPADTYESNMDENALVYSGTLVVPASARAGDWITIPLTTPFVYDPSRNLVVRFAGDNSGVSNTASAHSDATEFPSRSVGKNNNTAGNPSWDFDGAVNVRFGIQK